MTLKRSMRREGGGDRSGFTLIELLTVIAVIAMLSALLLPALAGAKRRAQAIRSASNARQLGLGMLLYAQDHGGLLPRDPREAEGSSWVEALNPYLGASSGVRVCPSDPFGRERFRAGSCSYVLNYYTSGGRPQSFDGPDGDLVFGFDPDRHLDSFPHPAETFLMFEASNAGVVRGAQHFDDHTHPDTWLLGWAHVLADIDPYRHGEGANYLFADGHVRQIAASRLKARIERGDLFALIPR